MTGISKPAGWALVTGASSGIGAAFARQLAARGHNLIVVGRRADRLDALKQGFLSVDVRVIAADLAAPEGLTVVADICAREEIALLVNNAGVSHYMAFAQLPADKAMELLAVKVVAPTMLARAAVPGMIARGAGKIVNVAGMLAYGAAAPLGPAAGRATYVGTLAHIVAFSQALAEELRPSGVQVQALCPGIVATEFHSRQGMDLSALPRMSADDVVTASLRGLELGEVVCAPGVDRADLIAEATKAELAAFGAQSPELATRYRKG